MEPSLRHTRPSIATSMTGPETSSVNDTKRTGVASTGSPASISTLLERLQVEYPDGYPDRLLRTVQRRLKVWRGEMARALVFGSPGSPPLDPVQATAVAPA